MVTDNPQTPRSSTNILYIVHSPGCALNTAQWKRDAEKAFSAYCRQAESLRYAKAHLDTSQKYFGIMCCGQMKLRYYLVTSRSDLFGGKRTKNLLPTVKFGGRSIMLWGTVARTCTGNLVKVEGCMDFSQYQQILKNNVLESVKRLKLRRGWLFQTHNDPKHCSKSTNKFIHRHTYNVLERSSQSPDVNIILNLWNDLKRAVHTPKSSNHTELETFCKEEWFKIPAAIIQGLISI